MFHVGFIAQYIELQQFLASLFHGNENNITRSVVLVCASGGGGGGRGGRIVNIGPKVKLAKFSQTLHFQIRQGAKTSYELKYLAFLTKATGVRVSSI